MFTLRVSIHFLFWFFLYGLLFSFYLVFIYLPFIYPIFSPHFVSLTDSSTCWSTNLLPLVFLMYNIYLFRPLCIVFFHLCLISFSLISFFISKLFNYWLFVLSLQNPFLQVEQIECSDGPSILLNLFGSKKNSFILDLYFCFLHSILHMFSFFSCLSLIASMLPKYPRIFLHSMHVSNQIFFLRTIFLHLLYLLFIYLPLIDLFFCTHFVLLIFDWLTHLFLIHSWFCFLNI